MEAIECEKQWERDCFYVLDSWRATSGSSARSHASSCFSHLVLELLGPCAGLGLVVRGSGVTLYMKINLTVERFCSNRLLKPWQTAHF